MSARRADETNSESLFAADSVSKGAIVEDLGSRSSS